MVPCPICKRKRSPHAKVSAGTANEFSMRVMEAPEGGYIWHCFSCDGTWDSLQLLAEVHHRGQIRDAINSVLEDPEFAVPQELLANAAVDDYIYGHLEAQKKAQIWSKEGREQWAHHRDLHAILADRIGLKIGFLEPTESIEKGIGRWLHATSRNALQEQLNAGLQPGIPDSSFRTCLGVPWSNAWGRISAVMLIGFRGQFRMWQPTLPRNEYRHTNYTPDVGIMMLDAIPANPHRITAVSSPFLALWLQAQKLKEDNHPAHVVAWHEHTDPNIWEQFGAKEVVFWGYEPTPALFKQAIYAHVDSYVAFLDNPSFDVAYGHNTIETYDTWNTFRSRIDPGASVKQQIHSLTHRLLRPYEACAQWLLSLKPDDVGPALEIMDLTSEQKTNLLNACKTYETRTVLARLIEAHQPKKTANMFNGLVTQYVGPDEAYWTITRNRGKIERLSEAVVELDRCIRDDENDRSLYTGVVHYKGQRFPFTATRDELLNDFVNTVTNVVESAGAGTPHIASSQSSKFWEIITNFSTVQKTTPSLTRVGWDKLRQDFYFPQFVISKGKLLPRQGVIPRQGSVLPGTKIDVPDECSTDDLDKLVYPSERNAAIWANLAAVVDNLIVRTQNGQPRGIGVLGQNAYLAAQLWARDLNLLQFTDEQIKTDFEAFCTSQRNHDLPVFVSEIEQHPIFSPKMTAWMMTPAPHNVIMPLSPMHRSTAELCGNWIIVRSSDDEPAENIGGDLAPLLVHYLAHYQRVFGRMPRQSKQLHSTLFDIAAWADEICTADSKPVFELAKAMLVDPGYETVGARFIYLLLQMIRDGYMKRDYGSTLDETSTKADIVIDADSSCVYVSKAKTVEALTKCGLPVLDTVSMTAALREEGALRGELGRDRAGWAIEMSYWDSRTRRWSTTRK